MQSVYTVSDLHLFSRRSRAEAQMDTIYRALEDADVFVLNGDIFDFRWSTAGGHEATCQKALAWLADILERAPKCQFHYVLGNHDNVAFFVDKLDAFAQSKTNLSWHLFHIRIGAALFLHGDVANRKMTADELAASRGKWENDDPKVDTLGRIYEGISRTGMVKAVYLLTFPERTVLRRLNHYLQDIGEGPHSGVRRVYFGHTHLAMDNVEYNGMTFHNGGAPMPGLAFRVLKANTELE